MPEYSREFSARKMKAVKAINKEVDIIEGIKSSGGKVRGNEPKMTLRGLRALLVSEDSLFADLVDEYEAGEINAKQLAARVRSRTEKIGKNEVIVHSDTIHHGNPLELADALDEMDPNELSDLLTEQYEVRGQTYGDTQQNIRGQSYTTRGHLAQSTNPRGRYKATNEFSEPGVTAISAHPRGANDPLMKAPKVKPRTRKEAQEFLTSKQPLVEESVELGSYADKDVRAMANQKAVERGIILPGDTLYRSDLPDQTLQTARKSFDNISDEVDLAKAFKTPELSIRGGNVRFKAARALPLVSVAAGAWVAGGQALAGDYKAAAGTVVDEVVSEAFLDTQPAASGTLTDAPARHQAIMNRAANPTVADKIIKDPINELKYAGKQAMKFFGGAIRMGSEAGF